MLRQSYAALDEAAREQVDQWLSGTGGEALRHSHGFD